MLKRLIAALATVLILAGCGLRGPLEIPPPPPEQDEESRA